MTQRPFLGLFVGLLAYGGICLLSLAVVAFALGSADFSEWGVEGRSIAVAVMLFSLWFGVLPLEAFEQRKALTDALADILEREA